MTTREKFEKMLVDMGVFESQASAIMDLAMPKFEDIMPGGYQVTWNRPAEEYPEAIYNVGFSLVVKKTALEWIDANIPQAWFRPMFV